MGIADVFNAEDRVSVKFSDFYSLMKEAAKAEIMLNGVKHSIPHAHIEVMMTGRLPDSEAKELKAYRELGLSPEDVKTIDKLYSEKCAEYGAKCSELADVKSAYIELKEKLSAQTSTEDTDND